MKQHDEANDDEATQPLGQFIKFPPAEVNSIKVSSQSPNVSLLHAQAESTYSKLDQEL